MAHLLNVEAVTVAFAARTLLDAVSPRARRRRPGRRRRPQRRRQVAPCCGCWPGGRSRTPAGSRTPAASTSACSPRPTTSTRRPTSGTPWSGDVPDHVWAADAAVRDVLAGLLGGLDAAAVGGLDAARRAPVRRAAAPGRAGRAADPAARRPAARRADEPPGRRGRRLAGRGTCARAGRQGRGGARRRHPRPVVPRRGLRRGRGRCTTASSTPSTAGTPPTCWPAPSAPGSPRVTEERRAEPAAQGAGLAAARAAGAHEQAAVPARRRRTR